MFFGTTDSCLDVICHSCEKNWTHMPCASGSYGRLAGYMLAGWLADEMQVEVEIFKVPYRLNYSTLILVQCYYSVRNAFHWAFFKSSFLKGMF